jgi:DNA processing protein
VVTVTDSERRARVALSFVADAGDVVLGAALRTMTAAQILAAIKGSDAAGRAVLAGAAEGRDVRRLLAKWRNRVSLIPSVSALAAWQEGGMRLIIPGDEEWPAQLDDLGEARPLVLWLRGTADLGSACLQSVAVVGSRAATAYGHTVAMQMGAELSEHGYAVVSGGSMGTIPQGACTTRVHRQRT